MRIWLLYANAGGGHRKPAEALAEEIKKQSQGQTEPVLVDITGKSKMVKRVLEQGYALSVDHFQGLYKALFEISKRPIVMRTENYLVGLLVGDFFVKKLQKEKPDKIVTFFYLVGPVLEATRKLGLKIPVTAIVTDPFTSHPFWFLYPEINYIVFSPEMRQEAVRAGVPEKNITVAAPIVHPKFTEIGDFDQTQLHLKLGLPAAKKIVLLMGGGNGLPQGSKAIEELLQSRLDAHFVVVCGNNQRLKRRAEVLQAQWGKERLTVYGFIDFTEQLIASADVVIGKAGASVMMETFLLKKPLIIVNYIWGQEQGNVDFAVRSRLGIYEPNLKKLPKLVEQMLFDEATIRNLEEARKNTTVTSGTEKIARKILEV